MFEDSLIPDLESIQLHGIASDQQSKQIIFAIKRCQDNCAESSEIDNYIESLEITGAFIEPDVDLTKYGNETLEFGLKKVYNSNVQKDRLNKIEIQIRNNTLLTNDNYLY